MGVAEVIAWSVWGLTFRDLDSFLAREILLSVGCCCSCFLVRPAESSWECGLPPLLVLLHQELAVCSAWSQQCPPLNSGRLKVSKREVWRIPSVGKWGLETRMCPQSGFRFSVELETRADQLVSQWVGFSWAALFFEPVSTTWAKTNPQRKADSLCLGLGV